MQLEVLKGRRSRAYQSLKVTTGAEGRKVFSFPRNNPANENRHNSTNHRFPNSHSPPMKFHSKLHSKLSFQTSNFLLSSINNTPFLCSPELPMVCLSLYFLNCNSSTIPEEAHFAQDYFIFKFDSAYPLYLIIE